MKLQQKRHIVLATRPKLESTGKMLSENRKSCIITQIWSAGQFSRLWCSSR